MDEKPRVVSLLSPNVQPFGAMGVIAYVLWIIIKTIFLPKIKKLSGRRFAVLGMKEAGKTRFYCFLRSVEYVEGQTSTDKYHEFTYKKKDGTEILIKEGYDIGGGENFIPEWYPKMLAESDSVIFVFDLYKYTNDENYKKQTNARLDYINAHCDESKESLTLLTHIDKFGSKFKKAVDRFTDEIGKKPYGHFVLRNYAPVDMTRNDMLRAIEDKIFK